MKVFAGWLRSWNHPPKSTKADDEAPQEPYCADDIYAKTHHGTRTHHHQHLNHLKSSKVIPLRMLLTEDCVENVGDSVDRGSIDIDTRDMYTFLPQSVPQSPSDSSATWLPVSMPSSPLSWTMVQQIRPYSLSPRTPNISSLSMQPMDQSSACPKDQSKLHSYPVISDQHPPRSWGMSKRRPQYHRSPPLSASPSSKQAQQHIEHASSQQLKTNATGDSVAGKAIPVWPSTCTPAMGPQPMRHLKPITPSRMLGMSGSAQLPTASRGAIGARPLLNSANSASEGGHEMDSWLARKVIAFPAHFTYGMHLKREVFNVQHLVLSAHAKDRAVCSQSYIEPSHAKSHKHCF